MSFIEQYLLQLKTEKRRWQYAVMILTALSLVVALVTAWNLRMTGITIVNDASCGHKEHRHTEACLADGVPICGQQEHIHDTGCYSDPDADTETALDWQNMFADYPYTGILREDLVGIARTQVGYTESRLNFEASDDGVRRGYTRYGAWYGAPYNDWSAMFVSFCLSYAGADPAEYPNSSGASSMAELWKKHERFASVGRYVPVCGDIVFLDDNTAGIVAEVHTSTIYVIRGDMDDAVRADVMLLEDPSITGWGITGEGEAAVQAPVEEDVLDISNGPAVYIFEGGTAPSTPSANKRFLRTARTVTELLP